MQVDWCLKLFFAYISMSITVVPVQVIFRLYCWWDFIALVLTFVRDTNSQEPHCSSGSSTVSDPSPANAWLQALCWRCIISNEAGFYNSVRSTPFIMMCISCSALCLFYFLCTVFYSRRIMCGSVLFHFKNQWPSLNSSKFLVYKTTFLLLFEIILALDKEHHTKQLPIIIRFLTKSPFHI